MLVVPAIPYHVRKAAACVASGGVVVYPTDTAYALGGRWDMRPVRQRIMRIKKRRDPRFTLIAADYVQALSVGKFPEHAKLLMEKYWPGPLSIACNNRVAVRVPDNAVARSLARRAGVLIATSANISGQAAAYSVSTVVAYFQNQQYQPDMVLDAGRLPRRQPSAVVYCGKGGDIKIIRMGRIISTIKRDRIFFI